MGRTLQALGEFCADLTEGQFVPNSKWFHDVAYGALTAQSLKLSEMSRALDEVTDSGEARRLIHTERRLSRGLNSDRLDEDALRARHLDRASAALRVADGEGCTLALDGSCLRRARSRTDKGRCVDGIGYVWDNSASEKVVGFSLVGLSALDAQDIRRPLALRPVRKSEKGSEVARELVQEVAAHVGPLAWLVSDRGFQGRAYFESFDATGLRWACRLKLGQPLLVETLDGRRVLTSELANDIPNMRTSHKVGRGRKRRTVVSDISRRKVRVLDGDGNPVGGWRTLITVWSEAPKPFQMLTSGWLPRKADVLEALRHYRRRWPAIEGLYENLKDRDGWGLDLNGIRALSFKGVRRLCLLAVALMAFVGEVLSSPEVASEVMRRLRSFDHMKGPGATVARVVRGAARVLDRVRRKTLRSWRVGDTSG